jgi:predicted nucleotidyltransferase component of viral defense system
MAKSLYYNTVSLLLLSTLQDLMKSSLFDDFRLVGGTSLSLQLGHRQSIDIDLFTDSMYDSVDFEAIDDYLRKNYAYVDTFKTDVIGMGKSYYIGNSKNECIKLDLFYTDPFIRPFLLIDGLRLASLEEIAAMKIDVISRVSRKKDFWDIHELMDLYSIEAMLNLHQLRYPYSHNRQEITNNFSNFGNADIDFDPVCLRKKYWEIIKLDITEAVQLLK